MELGAFSVSIPVSDVARSRAYYEAFGFDVVGGDEDEKWLILRNGEITVGLFAFEGMEFTEPMLTFNPGLGQDMSNPDEFTDIRDIRQRLLDAGIAIEADLDPDETGPASLGLHDPDGHPILIDQFRPAPPEPSDVVDLVIRGAAVVDGTGGAAVVADVAVEGERIARVGDIDDRGAVEVDGSGLVLAPGFIDVHSHDDFAVFLTPSMDFKTGQGVTTTVVGNCGLGAAPGRWGRSYLPFFGAEGHEDEVPRWDGYDGYLAAIDADPPALNVAALIGHGTARLSVMGGSDAAPTRREALHLADVVEEGLAAGAVGLSTGLVYEPGKHADTDEIVTLAAILHGTGARYTSHIRNEGAGLVDAVSEAIEIGRRSGVGVQISHHKAAGRDAWGLVARSLAAIEAARAEGLDVLADQYPYTAGSTSLGAVVSNGGFDESATGLGAVEPESVVLASCPRTPVWEGRSIAELAAELDTTPAEAADRVLDVEGAGAVVVLHSMCEDDVRTVMTHPTTMIGSDGVPTLGGKPHPRLYGTCARVLGTYVRDERVLGLEDAVHRMTGLPAAAFGLADRGEIRDGAVADLVLFDPATVADVATYDDPRRHPIGIVGVWVNGRRVVDADGPTSARPGRAIRRA